MIRRLLEDPKSNETLKWKRSELEELERVFRLAALLHDIGHSPFSHASEGLFPKRKSHEDYTYQIIINSDIGSIIEKHHGKDIKTRIADIATSAAKNKNDAFLSQLITGEIGTDRIDYLIRDSYHLGVAYGKFDYHRLFRSLHVRLNEEKKGPELAVYDGGIHAVEGLLLARYFMFLQVYFHKTRRILDYHLKEFLKNHLPKGRYSKVLDKFLDWDDFKVMELLSKKKNSKLSKRVMGRKHYRLCYQSVDHPEKEEVMLFEWLKNEVKEKYKDRVVFDDAVNSPHNYKKPSIFVLHDKKYEPIAERSSLIGNLREILKIRIYTEEKLRPKVGRFCEEFKAERRELVK